MLRLSLQKTTLLPPTKSLDDSNEADKRQTIFFFLKKKNKMHSFHSRQVYIWSVKTIIFIFFLIVPLTLPVRAAAAPYCSCCKEWLLGLIVRLVLCDSILRKLSVCGLSQQWWYRTSSLTKVQGKPCVSASHIYICSEVRCWRGGGLLGRTGGTVGGAGVRWRAGLLLVLWGAVGL